MRKVICVAALIATAFLWGCATYPPPAVLKGQELSRKIPPPKELSGCVKIVPAAMDKKHYSVMATALSPDESKLLVYAIKTPGPVMFGGMHMAGPLAKQDAQYLSSAIASTISGAFSSGLTGGALGLGEASFSQGMGYLAAGLLDIIGSAINPPRETLFIWKWPDLEPAGVFTRKKHFNTGKRFGFVGQNTFILYPSECYGGTFNLENIGTFRIKELDWEKAVGFNLDDIKRNIFSKNLKPNYCKPIAIDNDKLFVLCDIYKGTLLGENYYSSILVFDTKTKSVISKIGPSKNKYVDFVLPIPNTTLAFVGYWEEGFINGKASVYLIDYSTGQVDKAMSDMLRSPETFLITGHVKGVVPVDVRISQDGSMFALLAATSSGDMDKFKISLYDLTTGEKVADVNLPSSIGLPISWGFYKDNHQLILATLSRVYLIDPDTGTVYNYLSFSPDVIKGYFKGWNKSCFNYLTFSSDKKSMVFPIGSSVVIVDTVCLENEGTIKPISIEKLEEELKKKKRQEESTEPEYME